MGNRGDFLDVEKSLFRTSRLVAHPVVTIPIITFFSIWLFLHVPGNSVINVSISAALEWTKGVFAFIAIFGSLRLAKKENLLGWKFVSAACIFWTTGQVVYGASIVSYKRPDLPFALSDAFFLFAIPLAIVGVFMVGMHGLKKMEKLRIALDALAVACAIVFVSLAFFVERISQNQISIPRNSEMQFIFFLLDVAFASLALSMMLYRRLDKMIIPIGIGMVLQATADIMWVTDQFRGNLATRPFARLFLLIAAALYCFSATRTRGRLTKQGSLESERQLRLGVFGIVSVVIVFALFRILNTDNIPPIVAISFVALFFVTLFGQIVSHFENSKLTKEQNDSISAISQSEARFRIAFQNGPTGLLLVDPDGIISKANIAFGTMLSQANTDLIGKELIWLIHPDDRETHLRMSNSVYRQKGKVEYEVRFIEKGGAISWGSVSVSEMPGAEGEEYLVYQIEDTSERKSSQERLQYLAIHDPLTGLANRTYIVERLDEALRLAKAQHETLGVLFIDLDRFKVINDSLGHAVGDEVIQTIAYRIKTIVGERGTVARFGGDEFVVLLGPPTTEKQTNAIAKEILDEVIKPFSLNNGETYISCSIGVVLSDGENHNPQSLLRDADSAMYHAKELGRNRIETADRQVHKRIMRQHQTANELHRGVANNEMKVFYQPIIRLDTGEISGFEALVRWLHPKRGLIPPDDFIPLAEDTGLILEIGKEVMLEAYYQLVRWQEYYCQSDGKPLSMSVNLAIRQLSDPNLLDILDTIQTKIAPAPNSMVLEITESALLDDTRHAIKILNEIHSMGFKLRVDDFGTGYSSLSYLKRFPIDGFKIDKSFVAGLDIEENDTAIVHALIGLAKSMKLMVVAEGIETQAARDSLKALGCIQGQGYLYSKPKPAEQFVLEHNKQNILAGLGVTPENYAKSIVEDSDDVIDLESRRNSG